MLKAEVFQHDKDIEFDVLQFFSASVLFIWVSEMFENDVSSWCAGTTPLRCSASESC